MIKYSILILTHNRLEQVKRCFRSLIASHIPWGETYIGVFDNASTDGTADYICGTTWGATLGDENLGVAGGRAQLLESIKYMDSKYIIFLDSDTEIIDPEWLNKLGSFLDEHENVGLVGPGGSMVQADWSGFTAATPDAECDCVAGYCQMWRRSLLDLGLHIDAENYANFWHEDSAFCMAIREMSWDIWCLPVGVQHFPAHSGFGQDVALHDKHIAVFREQWRGKGLVKAEGAY